MSGQSTKSSQHQQLVAKPPIHAPSFEKLNANRCDEIYLYYEHQNSQTDYRYKLIVVDRTRETTTTTTTTSRRLYMTAAFIVPAGREAEYMFSTRTGLLTLAASAQTTRLITICLGRNHQFHNLQHVQEELTYCVQVLAWRERTPEQQQEKIPFMALDGIGQRNIMAQGQSTISGKYIVEQVKADDRIVRRLYFMDNPFVIQSEVALVRQQNGEDDDSHNDSLVDKSCAAFEYHQNITSGILAMAPEVDHGLIIGLGGGGLVNFLQYLLPSLHLHAIELDPQVVKIAQDHFGVEKSLNVLIGDGLRIHCPEAEAETSISEGRLPFKAASLSFIVIDVDSKDKTVGMSCPPAAFVESTYLETLAAILRPDGLLAINVSARDPAMLQTVCAKVKSVFPNVFLSRGRQDEDERQDLNVVVLATNSDREPSLELSVQRMDCDRLDPEIVSDLKAGIALIEVFVGLKPHSKPKAGKKNAKRRKGKRK